jgi:glycosyltransferase involved in cell wall biosynthesis
MKTFRVGLFSHDFHPPKGGQGRNFSELFQHLSADNRGIDFFAFSPCRNTLPNHKQLFWLINFLPLALEQLFFFLLLNLVIAKIIRSYKLDLIILNGGPGGIFLFKKPEVPVVFCTNHTYSQQSSLMGAQSWKSIFFPLEKRSYKLADKFISISSTTRDELINCYGLNADDITVIPVGIDLNRFYPREGEKIVNSLFFLGRLEKRKGIDFLVKTIPLIKRAIPNITLFVGGIGKLRESLEGFAADTDIKDQVTFLGNIPDDELPIWYNKCQILVVPSVFEGLGISVLEGLASGIPIIGTNVPGISDTIKNCENGILVEYGNQEQLAESIIELLSSQEKLELFRAVGLRQAGEVYSWDKIVDRYHSFIQSQFFNR